MHLFRNVYTYSHLHFLLHSNVLYLESGRSTPNTTVFDPSFKTTISRQNYCDNIASRPAQWLEQEQPQAAKESRRPAVCGDRHSPAFVSFRANYYYESSASPPILLGKFY
jgi:hypothetical protein